MEDNLKQSTLRLLQNDLNYYNQAWDLNEEISLVMLGIQTGDLIDWEKADKLVKKLGDAREVTYALVEETFRRGEDLKDQEDFITTKAAKTAGLDSKYSDLLWGDFQMAADYQEEMYNGEV